VHDDSLTSTRRHSDFGRVLYSALAFGCSWARSPALAGAISSATPARRARLAARSGCRRRARWLKRSSSTEGPCERRPAELQVRRRWSAGSSRLRRRRSATAARGREGCRESGSVERARAVEFRTRGEEEEASLAVWSKLAAGRRAQIGRSPLPSPPHPPPPTTATTRTSTACTSQIDRPRRPPGASSSPRRSGSAPTR